MPEIERPSRFNKPFFMLLHHMDPHSPYMPLAPYDRMFYHGNECDPRDSVIGGHVTDDLADFCVPYDKTDNLRLCRATSWKYQSEVFKVLAPQAPARSQV